MESRKATVYSKLVYIIVTFAFLYSGLGLFGVVIANLIAPFVNRFISYHFFFTREINDIINTYEITKNEKVILFKIIWYNAKKLGLVFLGAYAINKLSIFLAGLYLSLTEIASYGLMVQLIGLIATIAGTLFGIYQPRFSSLRITGNNKILINEFAYSMNIFYLLFIFGTICFLSIGPWALTLIHSNVFLPSLQILSIYAFIVLLEGNHSYFAALIITKNNIPFVESSLIAGGCIGLGSYLSLELTSLGILGLITVQGLTQLAYANWKWPYIVCKEFSISFLTFLEIGLTESANRLKTYINVR